ncbi:MAG TPA: glycosyltransferase family 4 protein [Verrucomicrobiae bacterium]|jgi:glycosyltransferase involved in cell wall biosynthesis|nr:glycosyltransferase family 4 protein [Verrucomicrobiae bacterium]
MTSIAILWSQFGPYHFARVRALKQLAGNTRVHALELGNHSRDYAWSRSVNAMELITLCPGMVAEKLPFQTVFLRTRSHLKELGVEVCFLPSYSPQQPLAALLAAKSLGIKTVMMNESHAGTARSGPAGTWLKHRLVGLFDAALVGGAPQKRYFASLGLPEDKIFVGYDAVDNDYFFRRAGETRKSPNETRVRYGLPENYFLSLGRFVAKKNLATLLRAFRKFLDLSPNSKTHLVMVGAGEEEPNLRALCEQLRLKTYRPAEAGRSESRRIPSPSNDEPGVHFFGFRQVEENPDFYALADAFILPSLYEEWGLVVNEAMASGLPVVVSETAGCAEDLLENGNSHGMGKNGVFESILSNGLAKRIRRNGFVFDPGSSDECAAIFRVLESQKELRQAMGAASREIVEKFSCRRFAENALQSARTALERS